MAVTSSGIRQWQAWADELANDARLSDKFRREFRELHSFLGRVSADLDTLCESAIGESVTELRNES
jgi:hypothetical protein